MKSKLLSIIYKKNLVTITKTYAIQGKKYIRQQAYVQKPDGGIVAYSGLGTTQEDAINFTYQMLDKQGNPVSDLCSYYAAAIPGVPEVSTHPRAFCWKITEEEPNKLAALLQGYRALPLESRKIFDNEFGCLTNDLYGYRQNGRGLNASGMDLKLLLECKLAILGAKYPQDTAFQNMCLV